MLIMHFQLTHLLYFLNELSMQPATHELLYVKWNLKKLNQVNAEAHTVAVLTLILPCTLVTMATIMM